MDHGPDPLSRPSEYHMTQLEERVKQRFALALKQLIIADRGRHSGVSANHRSTFAKERALAGVEFRVLEISYGSLEILVQALGVPALAAFFGGSAPFFAYVIEELAASAFADSIGASPQNLAADVDIPASLRDRITAGASGSATDGAAAPRPGVLEKMKQPLRLIGSSIPAGLAIVILLFLLHEARKEYASRSDTVFTNYEKVLSAERARNERMGGLETALVERLIDKLAWDGSQVRTLPRPVRDPLIRDIQKSLRSKGHDPGDDDGIAGPRTRNALMSYQRVERLPATGALDSETILRLLRPKPGDAAVPAVPSVR
jgi:hypothetical protein